MNKYYSISIPKPCHEDWKTMTPKEKGRFCNSCSKTVIDFTKMNTYEIQDFINDNQGTRICGHFKQTQLDSINLHIPSKVLEQQKSFHKIFLLALLIVMGTTLMNCTNKNGNKQKIDSIEIIDTINKTVNDTKKQCTTIVKKSSSKTCTLPPPINPNIIHSDILEGELVIEPTTTRGLPIYEKSKSDSLDIPELQPDIDITGEISAPEIEGDLVLGFVQVETPPEFKNTPTHLSKKERREYFTKKISELVSKNFNPSVYSELTGKQRIQTQFKIDKKGDIIDIKARAPHPKLEIEAIRVIKLLPKFIPAQQSGRPVDMVYTLPIIFHNIE